MVQPRKIAAFNLRRVIGLLNSAAYARAARAQVYQGSSRFSENTFANALLIAITGEPGYPEVMMDAKQIEAAQRAHLQQLVELALGAMGRGPRDFVSLLEETADERAQDIAAVRNVFRTTIATANRISGNLDTTIKGCAAVQLASTVVLAATPVGLTFAGASAAATTGWVAVGYGVAKNLAKDLGEAKGAGIMAFEVTRKNLPKDVIQQAGDTGADKVADAMERRIERHTDLIEQAEQKIAQLSRMVQHKVSTSKIAKLNRQIGRNETAAAASGRAITQAHVVKFFARSLQVVFAAHDICEGWEEFEKVWNSH
jgi:hypothetical protein